MSPRNSIKHYIENGYYHIYNRGVEKRRIFQDKQDYGVFLSYLKEYLTAKKSTELLEKLSDPDLKWIEKDKILKLIRLNNFAGKIELLCYCLMPNHFHLLIKQSAPKSIDSFINSLNTRYVMYFNKKYKRIGPLYQGVYKAVLIETDEQLLHLSAYIHRNPSGISFRPPPKGDPLEKLTKQPSSLPEYLKIRKCDWIETKTILSFFSFSNKNLTYKKFVLASPPLHPEISSLIIED